ncbi:sigma-70 family RNA polymerase sigma factor [Paenibacillus aurantius]|uniref:sigma-70 family RNA polymerase sigma factor n=1 Tax=Paenibacillus aurantius TaxID=2918900 RepID=UPI00387FA13B
MPSESFFPIEEPGLEELYLTYKPLLLSLGYKLLGSRTEAEDAVHDVFLSLRQSAHEPLRHPKAYLVKLLTNRCLNLLKAGRRRRETYPGSWLPEPDFSVADHPGAEGRDPGEPGEQLILRETVSYALLVLLQELTPQERAVFVLRESLGYDYKELAALLNKTEPSCRKLFSRAKAKLGKSGPPVEKPPADAEAFIRTFLEAAASGRFEPFVRLLAEEAVMVSDGGGKVRSALVPIEGRARIGAFFTGIRKKGSLHGSVRPVPGNGPASFVLDRPGRPPFVFSFAWTADGSRISAIYLLSNPDKLTLLPPLGESGALPPGPLLPE